MLNPAALFFMPLAAAFSTAMPQCSTTDCVIREVRQRMRAKQNIRTIHDGAEPIVCLRVAERAFTIDVRANEVYEGAPASDASVEASFATIGDLLAMMERRLSPFAAILQRKLKLRGDVGPLQQLSFLWPEPSSAGRRRLRWLPRLPRLRRLVWRPRWLRRGAIAAVGSKAMHAAMERLRRAHHRLE